MKKSAVNFEKWSKSNNRYYLHRMVRKSCLFVRLEVLRKTICVKHSKYVDALNNKYVLKLMELGYSLQTEI